MAVGDGLGGRGVCLWDGGKFCKLTDVSQYSVGAYQFGDEWNRLPPGSNVRHAVDVAVEGVVSRMPAT